MYSWLLIVTPVLIEKYEDPAGDGNLEMISLSALALY